MSVISRPFAFGLTAKLTIIIESIVILIVLANGIVTTIREKNTLDNETTKTGLSLTAELAKFAAIPLISQNLPDLAQFIDHTKEHDYVLYVTILDLKGNAVMHGDSAQAGITVGDHRDLQALNSKEPVFYKRQVAPKGHHYCDIFYPIVLAEYKIGTVRMGYSLSAVEKEMAMAVHQILYECLATALAGFVFSFLAANYISVPIKQITDATRKVAKGDLNAVVTIKKKDEIGELAEAFNQMTADLRRTTISRNYFDNMIQSMNDTFVMVDPAAKIRAVNKALCAILGYDESELVGEKIHLIIAEDEKLFKNGEFQHLLDSGSLDNCEIDYVTKQGNKVPMLFSATVLWDEHRGIKNIMAIAHDITHRRRSEEALRRTVKALHILSSKLLTAQENERRRLSVELHDELGQALMVLKLKIRSLFNMDHDEREQHRAECHWVISYIDELTENVRRLSKDLSPPILKDLGLSAAVRRLVETAADTSAIKSTLDMVPIDHVFVPDEQINVYRIIQECLTNIAKHADASHMSVSIGYQGNLIVIKVEDNGKGFDINEASLQDPSRKGIGLTAMHERARMLGGALEISSLKGKGTRITITLPLD